MIVKELILHIGSYCSIKDIYNFSLTSKNISEVKLYRLCISHIFCNRYYGEYSSITEFKNHLKDLNPTNLQNNKYNLNNYICDLTELLFNNECITVSNKYYYKKYKFSIEYKHSFTLLYILKDYYRITKNNIKDKNELKHFPRCHHVYRVCPVAYTRLRKNHLNILALIY